MSWLALLTALFWISMVIDFTRRRPATYWIFILIFFYGIGPLIYFIVVVAPEWQPLNQWDRWFEDRKKLSNLSAQVSANPAVGVQQDYADLLQKNGRSAEARDMYRKVLLRIPEDLYARYGMARALIAIGEKEEALEHLAFIIKANPRHGYGEAALDYANLLGALGKSEEAIKAYRNLLRFNRFSEARARLAMLLAGRGETDEALELAQTIVEDFPATPKFNRPKERPWYRWAKGYLAKNRS